MADVCFSETEVIISQAMNCDMSTKFGALADFDFLKAVTSTLAKPEVVLSGRGRHLEISIRSHISAVGAPIWTNSAKRGIWSIERRHFQ